jgi:hypothetical protein
MPLMRPSKGISVYLSATRVLEMLITASRWNEASYPNNTTCIAKEAEEHKRKVDRKESENREGWDIKKCCTSSFLDLISNALTARMSHFECEQKCWCVGFVA